MKLLLVAKLFPPDTGVSTLRMKFFYDSLVSNGYDVDVLKLAKTTDLSGKVKLIDGSLFEPFFTAILNRNKIHNLLKSILNKYDLVIVSAAPYGLYEVAYSAKNEGVPFILDLRDLPDLTTSEQKKTKPFIWLSLKAWLIDMYIKSIACHSKAILCVGAIATALTQFKLKYTSVKVLNIHNGFNLGDINLLASNKFIEQENSTGLVISCVGNIHDFRDTQDLRLALYMLNKRTETVTLIHWGKVGLNLLSYIKTLNNIKYEPRTPIPRNTLIHKLNATNCFLLPCADDLIWEPTTSVFDYILYNKPVIFTGLKNNEAYNILRTTQTTIIESDEISDFDFVGFKPFDKNSDNLICYSREYHFEMLLNTIKNFIG